MVASVSSAAVREIFIVYKQRKRSSRVLADDQLFFFAMVHDAIFLVLPCGVTGMLTSEA